VFNEFPGLTKIFLTINQSGSIRKIETDFKINYNTASRQKLELIVGSGNIKLE